jgi:hypothetical protein
MGGMHVSCLPRRRCNIATAVVAGEAEVLWPALLQDFQGTRSSRFTATAKLPPHRPSAAERLGIVPPEKLSADSFHGDHARLPAGLRILRRHQRVRRRLSQPPAGRSFDGTARLRPFTGLLTLKNLRVFRGRQHRQQSRLRPRIFHPHRRPEAELVRPGLGQHRQRPGDFEALRKKRLHRAVHGL